MSAGDVLKALVGTSLGVTYRKIWGRPHDVTLRHPQDVIFQLLQDGGRGRPQDVDRGRPLALHRGPYGDVLRTSSGRNFADWVVS